MIPLWWSGLARPFASGGIPLGPNARRLAQTLYSWVWVVVLVNYLVVAAIAQMQLNWFAEFAR
ncbi:hypothetical protein [Leucobacter soli]